MTAYHFMHHNLSFSVVFSVCRKLKTLKLSTNCNVPMKFEILAAYFVGSTGCNRIKSTDNHHFLDFFFRQTISVLFSDSIQTHSYIPKYTCDFKQFGYFICIGATLSLSHEVSELTFVHSHELVDLSFQTLTAQRRSRLVCFD